MEKIKIAIVASHPIQHFCPQYVSFTKNSKATIKVFFGSALGHKKYEDENFKEEISWSNLNLDKFPHVFLNGDQILEVNKDLDAPSLEQELKVFKPHILITYGYFQRLQRRARSWSIQNKIPIAYISDSEKRHKISKIKQVVKHLFVKNYFSRISWFLTMGNANEEYYKLYGVNAEQMIRMHYPIDIIKYQESFNLKDELRKKIRGLYGIGSNETVISVVGKLVSWKNQDHIIDAMKLLEKKGIYIHLFMIGSGDLLDEWTQKACILEYSKVHFTGFVNIEDLPGYYAASDIYVHPASLEPHSVAISEAIFMGCPIVISDRCGSYGDEDDVQEGKNGFVYPFGDIKSLAEKIEKIVLCDDKRREFSNYSHQIASSFQHSSHFVVLKKLIEKLTIV